MIFGIPWYAIVAIIAVSAPFIFAYKEKELKNEEKRMANSKELNEIRKLIHNLKVRVDHLEAKVAEKTADPLSSIEIDDDESSIKDQTSSQKSKIH